MEQSKNQISWLASYPKSGNTWIRTFIQAYLFNDVDINNLFVSGGDIDPRIYNTLSAKPPIELHPLEILLLRNAALLRLVHNADWSPLILKTHNSNTFIGDMALIPNYITKNAIYVVRDPRDVIVSYSKHMGLSYDDSITQMNDKENIITNRWGISHFLGDWSMNVKSWLDQNEFPVVRVKYEDMRKDAFTEFEKMVRAWGFTYNAGKIKKALELVDLKKLRNQENKKGFKERPSKSKNTFFGNGKVKGWENLLTEDQVRKIEQAHGEVMEAMGYKLEYL